MLVPVPGVLIPPGFLVNVHVPDGNPLSTTLPVATVQLGCVTVPADGAAGTGGCAFMTTLSDASEVHP